MTNLEKLTHISLIALSCVSMALLIEGRIARSHNQTMIARPISERDFVGRTISVSGVDWHSAPLTLVLHLSSTCPYCDQSMPLYQKLAAARAQHKANVALVVSSVDDVETMQKHLAQRQVSVDRVISDNLDSSRIAITPGLLIVDSSGLVVRAFFGKLDHSGETELLRIVERGAV